MFLLFWFFTEHGIYHFSKLAFWNRLLRLRAGNLRLQVEHESFQLFASGVEFFDFQFKLSDFGSQAFRNFFLVHGEDYQANMAGFQ